MNIFDSPFGLALNPSDLRPMSEDEIAAYEASLFPKMRQAVFPAEYHLRLANWRPYPDKPLDERYADFKIRLAAAIERRKLAP